jgi:signal transduction histidine kinase
MTHYIIASLLTFFTTLFLAVFVYFKNPKSLINRLYALEEFSAAFWIFCYFKMITSANVATGLFWSRALHAGAVFIPLLFLHFGMILLNLSQEKRKIIVVYYIFCFILLALLPTKLFVLDAAPKFAFRYFIVPGPLYHLFTLYFFTCAVYTLYYLLNGFRNSRGLRRNQLKYLFFAYLIGYGGGGVSAFLPLFNIPTPHWGLYLIPLCMVIITYAIVKYRLMDINIAIKTGTAYVSLAVLTTGISIGLILGADRVFAGYPGYNPILATAIILLIIIPVFTYVLPWARPKTENAVEKILYKNKYAYLDTLRDFSQRMTFILNQEELMQSIVKKVVDLMGVVSAYVFVANEVTGKLELKAQTGETLPDDSIISEGSAIIEHLRKNKRPFLKEEMERILPHKEMAEIEDDLRSLEAVLCFPLIAEDELIGICALGEKVSKEMFSHLDIELLETLCNQIALIINYRRMEEQLRRQEKLLGLGTIAAGIGHEIGNAIVSVQTFLELFPERRQDKEFCDNLGTTALEDARRVSQLVDMMRKLAQPRSEMQAFTSLELERVIGQAIQFLQNEIEEKHITINTQYDRIPAVSGDESLLLGAFLNLFHNSLDALQKDGRITISTSHKNKVRINPLGKPQECVRIVIADNGPGIEKEHLSQIFEPFYTTRFKGTGLGLPMVHRIIEEHGGNIVLDSRVGEGTTFIINLPVEGGAGKGMGAAVDARMQGWKGT